MNSTRKRLHFIISATIVSIILLSYSAVMCGEVPICTAPHNQNNPAISGNYIVWEDYRSGNNMDIYMYNLETSTEVPICTASYSQVSPAISGNYTFWNIVWMDDRNDNGDHCNWDIYSYNFFSSTEVPICTAPDVQGKPSISLNHIVWSGGQCGYTGTGDVYMYDLITSTEIPICTESYSQVSPAISGNYIVWEDHRNGNGDIYMYDLTTSTEIPICTEPHDQASPAISGNKIVWVDGRNWFGDIYMYNLDGDGDGILDYQDSCPGIANTNQANSDSDTLGDACDNCPYVENQNQADSDGDTIGNACDNCPNVSNPDQTDTDGDVLGDVCDGCTDTDNDGYGNPGFSQNTCLVDNCPITPNSNQANSDSDTLGDACDNCPYVENQNQADTDGDGVGDACEVTTTTSIPLPECDSDADCDDDGLYCNGDEVCKAGKCRHEGSPCPDDGIFCNGKESCDEGNDECVSSGNPCAGELKCDEEGDACVGCLQDQDCDDSLFCTGEELCVGGACQPGTNPCKEPTPVCNEEEDSCEPKPVPCDVTLEPATAEVVSGQTQVFSVNTTGDCTTPDYEWSIDSTIGSKIEQDGTYTAGINFDLFNRSTDVVQVNDTANNLSAEVTVTVSIGCALLTIYGEGSEEVAVLRDFRDNILSSSPEGQEIINLYYQWSPMIVKAMEEDEEFKALVKEMIDGVLGLIGREME